MKPLFFILLCITILFLQQISFADAGKGSIEDVCSHTEDPDQCTSILKFDPRTDSGKLKVFCVIKLEMVWSKAQNLKNKCPDAYVKLVGHVGDAIKGLQTEQAVAMVVDSVKNAFYDTVSCYINDQSILGLLKLVLAILRVIDE